MRRLTVILCFALIAAFLIPLTGCTPASDPTSTPTQPTEPSLPTAPTDPPATPTSPTDPTEPSNPPLQITECLQLDSTIYITDIRSLDGALDTPVTAQLRVTVTPDADGYGIISMDMTYVEGLFYHVLDFQDSGNSFTIKQPDPALPIYLVVANIRQAEQERYNTVQFFIDFERGQLLFDRKGIPPLSYTVASTDPAADPYAILDYFLPALKQLYPGLEDCFPMPEQSEQPFYYALSGTWLDAEGQPAENMDFRLVGNLTDKVYMNDDLERNLLFLWPENFGYENAEPVSESITLTAQAEGPNYHGVGLLRDTTTDELTTFWFNIFPEDEIVILQMNGKYLVSSVRSELDAATILSQYQDQLIRHNAQAVDWEMTAYLVQADGTVTDTSTMGITGYIREHSEMYSHLVLDSDFPAGFRFDSMIPGPYGNFGYCVFTKDPNDYCFNGVAFDTVTNVFGHADYAINTEKEYYFGFFGTGGVQYLVACTDPNVTAEEILAHFQDYLEHLEHTS